jgi:hypothetical protein
MGVSKRQSLKFLSCKERQRKRKEKKKKAESHRPTCIDEPNKIPTAFKALSQ